MFNGIFTFVNIFTLEKIRDLDLTILIRVFMSIAKREKPWDNRADILNH